MMVGCKERQRHGKGRARACYVLSSLTKDLPFPPPRFTKVPRRQGWERDGKESFPYYVKCNLYFVKCNLHYIECNDKLKQYSFSKLKFCAVCLACACFIIGKIFPKAEEESKQHCQDFGPTEKILQLWCLVPA